MARPWIFATGACVAALVCGCAMDNPAFNPEANSGETGSTTQTSESASATATMSGGSESATTTSSTTDDPMESAEAPEPPADMEPEPEPCITEATEGFFPQIGTGPELAEAFNVNGCPLDGLTTYVRVHEQTDGGDWLARLCPDSCGSCPDNVEPVVVSAHWLALAELIPPSDFSIDFPTQGCYWIQAEELVSEPGGECIYASMSIFDVDEGLGALEFAVNRDSWGLTEMAKVYYGDYGPPTIDRNDVDQCVCDDTLGVDIDCCPNELIKPKKFDLGQGTYAYPGDAEPVLLDGVDSFLFYAAQAQSGINCEFGEPQTSWALFAL